ncbi:hypothetical protein BP5796_05030 [Coleophoma crateriformis]|uniref:Glycoside hydrolase family 1 protein n=1 Tax=Coleophoma crateriformis TaxID=565419 RepID=A0A3D8S1Z7_9HELO|nr:hypothetical protein BP5796_05030 [Coleophoma crateriformis]
MASNSASSIAPQFTYGTFSYAALSTTRYATPLPSPVTYAAYAPAFTAVSTLLPLNATTTTYSLVPNATDSADMFGQSAYSALWNAYSYNLTVPFTTTVSPTPVAATDLIYPPPTYTPYSNPVTSNLLPADFVWGVAGSAWQVEGGLQIEGRGPAVLDFIGALPDTAGATPPVTTTMNYFLYKQDILRLAALGIPYYSFSIAWPRIVPFGKEGSPINQQALDHYEEVIDFCLENGVTPVVTLVHFDYPLLTPPTSDTFPAHFLYYAKQVLTRFADRVPIWVTFNEPNNLSGADFAYNINILLSHSAVYNFYKDVLKGTGKMTLKLSNNFAVPLDPTSANDTAAALRYQDFLLGILGNPLFLGQNYPDSVQSTFNTTYLPPLTDAQIEQFNGTIDFFSIDPYTTQFATPPDVGIEACIADPSNVLWPVCVNTTFLQADGWLDGNPSNDYVHTTPAFFTEHMSYLWNTFKPSGILISEYGFNQYNEALMAYDIARFDTLRSMYYQEFVDAMRMCIWDMGINIIGALAWAYVDNDEFGSFSQRYGLQSFNETTFERSFKRSIFDYVDLFTNLVSKD